MISIIIATYNGEKYIIEQLESIRIQTLKSYEIIIIDDNSSDKTCLIIEQYLKNNPFHKKITFIKNNTNIGVNKSFELGIYRSNGEYIAFCDQDDIWIPIKLETLYNKIKNSHKQIIFAPSLILKNSTKTNEVYLKPTLSKNIYNQLLDNKMRGASSLISSSFIKSILPFPEYDLYDKYIYFAGLCTNKLIQISMPLDYYRIHNSNIVGTRYKRKSKTKVKLKLARNAKFYEHMYTISQKSNYPIKYQKIFKEYELFFYRMQVLISTKNSFRTSVIFYIKDVLLKRLTIKHNLIFFYYIFIIKIR